MELGIPLNVVDALEITSFPFLQEKKKASIFILLTAIVLFLLFSLFCED